MAATETKTESRPEEKEVVEDCPEPLKYKTWVLKVSIHCEGCRRKIKKILTNIDGVYTTNIDLRQQKVIVTGNVDADTLIKKIAKAGRHAELWPESTYRKDKKPKKPKKKDKQSDEEESSEEDENQNDGGPGAGENGMGVLIQEPKPEVKHVVTFVGSGQPQTAESSGGGGGGAGAKKKKKRRKKKNSSSTNEGAQSNSAPAGSVPPPPQSHGPQPYQSHYAPPPSYTVSYKAAYPSSGVYNTAHYAPPPSYYSHGYVHAGKGSESPPSDFDSYPSKGSASFEFFSDENPNACLVM